MMMPYNTNEAIAALKTAQGNADETLKVLKNTHAEAIIPENVLLETLNSLSANVEGATSGIVYSGDVGTKRGFLVAKDIANTDTTIAIIDKTDAFKILRSAEFREVLEQSVGSEKYNTLIDGSFDEKGLRQADSLWDDISRKFASGLSGSVMTVTPNADARRVFAQTELPALLENSKVTKINGVDKVAYSGRYIQLTAQGASPEDAIAMISLHFIFSPAKLLVNVCKGV